MIHALFAINLRKCFEKQFDNFDCCDYCDYRNNALSCLVSVKREEATMADAAELDLSRRLPTADETEKALQAMTALGQATTKQGIVPLRVTGDGERTVELPPAVGRIVMELLMHISRGEAVTFVPFGAELTTQQAADMLNVSRPFLIKLLQSGHLPFHMVGSHRRISASDLMAYRRQRETRQKEALKELAGLGQQIDAE
jgi:excisionase family DNA binding protein